MARASSNCDLWVLWRRNLLSVPATTDGAFTALPPLKFAGTKLVRVAAFALTAIGTIKLRVIASIQHIAAEKPSIYCKLLKNKLAERGGFEPPVEFLTLRRFSKPLLSTTQPPLRDEFRLISVRCGFQPLYHIDNVQLLRVARHFRSPAGLAPVVSQAQRRGS
jgi:hypothetical protein